MKVQIGVVLVFATFIYFVDKMNGQSGSNDESKAAANIEAFARSKVVSTNADVQRAYERCHLQTSEKFNRDNAHLNNEQRQLMRGALPDVCRDVIVGVCSKTTDNKHCQDVIRPYL